MYCPDTLHRINRQKVEEYQDQLDAEKEAREEWEDHEEDGPEPEHTVCEFCEDEPATQVIPVYNPADKVEGRGQDAYAVYNICDKCMDLGRHMEDNFYCDACGELFIYNHSWDVLAVTKEDGIYCQACAADDLEGVELWELLAALESGSDKRAAGMFSRLSNLPGKNCFWSGGFSQFRDFPGHTGFSSVAEEIRQAAADEGLVASDIVYPVLTDTRQFHVNLAVYC